MNLFLLTQPDAFYIPRLLDRFMQEKLDEACIVGAAALKGEIAAGMLATTCNFSAGAAR